MGRMASVLGGIGLLLSSATASAQTEQFDLQGASWVWSSLRTRIRPRPAAAISARK